MEPWPSIVIPARHDAGALARTLDHLARLPGIDGAEVIVAAAGDPAGTRAGRGRWPTFLFIVWLLAVWMLGLDTERYAERWRGPAGRTPGTPWPGPEATRPS
jgi:hypothetical protein